MIKNCYFKCSTCGEIITKYMDSQYQQEALNNLTCNNCGSNDFTITDSDVIKTIKVKNKVRDNRAIDKERYMSQEYKDIRANINRVHKERKGLLGEYGRKFV